MFGQMGTLMQLMKDMPRLKEQMEAAQQRLSAARFVGEAGAGQAKATVDGKGEMISLELDPQLVASGDKELIEELTVAATRQAVALSRTGMQDEIKQAFGGLDLSALGGLGNMFGSNP